MSRPSSLQSLAVECPPSGGSRRLRARSSTQSVGVGSTTRTVLSRLVPPGAMPSRAHTASGPRSATNPCVAAPVIGAPLMRHQIARGPTAGRRRPPVRTCPRRCVVRSGRRTRRCPCRRTRRSAALSSGLGTSGIVANASASPSGRTLWAHSDVNITAPSTLPLTWVCVVARPVTATFTSMSTTIPGVGDPRNWVVIHCSGRPVARSEASTLAAIPEPP